MIEMRSDSSTDWTAGILACNAVASAAWVRHSSESSAPLSCFALMQARMPAVQSVDDCHGQK